MSSSKHPIGLLGGTFDPIHYGHLDIASSLLDELNLDSVQFIPCRTPPHRELPQASVEDRLMMVKLATAQYPDFIVNDIELHRDGPSYSIDTIKSLRARIPKHPLCLILGEDALIQFNQWHQWEQIPELVHLVVVNRPGYALPEAPWMQKLVFGRKTSTAYDLSTAPGGKIYFHTQSAFHTNATDIRQLVKADKNIDSDVPPEILQYIKQHKLYR